MFFVDPTNAPTTPPPNSLTITKLQNNVKREEKKRSTRLVLNKASKPNLITHVKKQLIWSGVL